MDSVHSVGAAPLLLPRHREAAARALAYFLLAGGPMVTVFAALVPSYGGPTALTRWTTAGFGAVMLLLGVATLRAPQRFPEAYWVVVPFLAIAMIAGLDLLTADSSVGAHLYFLWPPLYSALYLHRRAVYAVLGAVAAGDAAVVFALEPPTRASTDLVSMATALTLATLVIMRLREGSDQLLEALEVQAMSDPLTGVGNRRAFATRLEQAVARARRTNEPLSLVTVDIDHFKDTNDRYGHPAGDAVLQAVADLLGTVVRRSEVIARLGGDEFVALIEAGREGAYRVAEDLRAAMAGRVDLPGGPPTLSIGVATAPPTARTAEALLAASDAALYLAKAGGRDRTAMAPEVVPGARAGGCPGIHRQRRPPDMGAYRDRLTRSPGGGDDQSVA